MTTIKISQEELFKLLNLMKPFVRQYSKKKAMSINCEAIIKDGSISLSIPNCNMVGSGKTTGVGSFTMPFLYLYKIIQVSKTKLITITIAENKVFFEQTSFNVPTKLDYLDKELSVKTKQPTKDQMQLHKLQLLKQVSDQVEKDKRVSL